MNPPVPSCVTIGQTEIIQNPNVYTKAWGLGRISVAKSCLHEGMGIGEDFCSQVVLHEGMGIGEDFCSQVVFT